MERCVSCQYYDRQSGQSLEARASHAGLCRRSAPALNPANQKTYMVEGVWPTVRDDDWCGEWKALVRRVDPARMVDGLTAVAGRETAVAAARAAAAVNLMSPSPVSGTSAAAAATAFTRARASAD